MTRTLLAASLLIGWSLTFVTTALAYPIPALTPPVNGGLVYHVDASDLDGDGVAEGVSESGISAGKVTLWVDKAAGYVGGDVAQTAVLATGIQQPNFINGALNTRPVVRFDGVDDYLKSPACAAPLAQSNHVFLVWKTDSVSRSASVAFDGLAVKTRRRCRAVASTCRYGTELSCS